MRQVRAEGEERERGLREDGEAREREGGSRQTVGTTGAAQYPALACQINDPYNICVLAALLGIVSEMHCTYWSEISAYTNLRCVILSL